MKNIEFVINKQLFRYGFWPLVLTIIFVITTLIIITILIQKELKKEGRKK